MLQVKGNRFVDNQGWEIVLKGYNLGNWLMLENFMLGIPGVEQQFRGLFQKYGGREKADFFFDCLLNAYIQESDIAYLKNLGCNAVRIPFNFRHFETDAEPFVYSGEAFRHLDRVVNLCEKYGIYVILDMHATPGYQNGSWHSDNHIGEARLFKDGCVQKRMAGIWRFIAAHFKGREIIAGYDLMNEPAAVGIEEVAAINRVYRECTRAIREVDPDHIVFIKGNMFGRIFDGFDPPFADNLAYSPHYYPDPSLVPLPYPGIDFNTVWDKNLLIQQMDIRDEFMRGHNVPCWIGEFGILSCGGFYEDKLRILRDQLEIFNTRGHSWSLWSYKDVGNMGTVYPDPQSPWMQFVSEEIRLKLKYHSDFDPVSGEDWDILSVMKPFYQSDFEQEFVTLRADLRKKMANTFSTYLAERFAKRIAALSLDDLALLAGSFAFEKCLVRKDWEEIVRGNL